MKVDRAMFIGIQHPYPVRSGSDLRCTQLIAATAARAAVSVFSLSQSDAPDVAGVEWCCAPVARPTRADLIRASLQWIRPPDGHPSDYLWNPRVADALIDFVDRVRPQVVILESLQTRRALEVLGGRVPAVVYDSLDVLTPLVDELVGPGTGEAKPAVLSLFSARTKSVEDAVVRSVDQTWVCCARDAELMARHHPGASPIAVIPNTVSPPATEPPVPPPREAIRVVFPASFGYPPNVRAAHWLVDSLLPALRHVSPGAELTLVGAGPPDRLEPLARSTPGVTVTGPVDDTAIHITGATAVVVPVREGGGTRLKVLEAAVLGVPVVSTAKGVEGLDMVPGTHYLGAETVAEFTDALVRLHRDRALARLLVQQAYAHVSTRYLTEHAQAAVSRALDALEPRRRHG